MKNGQKGFSILELTLSASLLLVVFFVVFALFELGTQNFHVGLMRNEVQNDVRKAWLHLERDLRQTTLVGVTTTSGAAHNVTVSVKQSNVSVARAFLCMPGLSNWTPTAPTFSPTTGLPRWDRYVLYQTTKDNPDGRLYRIDVDTIATFQGGPFSGFAAAVASLGGGPPTLTTVFAGGQKVVNIKCLSKSVFSFEAVSSPTEVQVILKIRGKNKAEAGQGARDETFEVNLKITPNNAMQG